MLLFLFNLEFCCHIPLLIYTVKFHFLVNPILTGSIVIEQWIEFGFEMVITVRFQYNANARLRYDDTFADALFDNAFRQEYNVSASGGNDRTDFYVSMGYLDNDSYVLGSSYERFTARANVNSQLKSWLKVGTNVGYSKATQNGVQENAGTASNPFAVARSWAPIFPVHAYDAEGNMKYYEDGRPMYDAGNGETDGTSKRPTATNQNVIANMREDIRESVYNNLTSRSYIEISFLKNFKFTANYSYDFTNDSETLYYTPTIGDGQSFGGRGTQASINTTTTNFNQILAYSNVFGDTTTYRLRSVMNTISMNTTILTDRKQTFLIRAIRN